jgi:hypothetical protein
MEQKKFDAAESRPDLIDLKVPTDPEMSRVDGRNGMFRIEQLYIWESVDHRHVYIDGIGKRNVAIRGGLRVSMECFAEVCRQFLHELELRKTRENLAALGEAVAARAAIWNESAAERCERIPDEEAAVLEASAQPYDLLGCGDKSVCPKCRKSVELLSSEACRSLPAFYICWDCRWIGQVGMGPVTVDDEDRADGPKKI